MNYRFLELKKKIFKFLCKLLPRFIKKRNKKEILKKLNIFKKNYL